MAFTPTYVQVPPNSTGQQIDGALVTDGGSVMRQIICVADPITAANVQTVKGVSAAPTASDFAAVVVLSPNQQAIPVSLTGGSSIIGQVEMLDGTGLAINSLSAGTGQNGMMVALGATNFVPSTNNSTVAQLAAGTTFTGVIETIFNEQTISVLATTDQPGILTLNQYIDAAGTRLISSWPFTVAAGAAFSRSFTGNGNYFNLTFKNTGAVTTTTLNVNTAYGILFPATNLGNVPISINEINGTTIGSSFPVGGVLPDLAVAGVNYPVLMGGTDPNNQIQTVMTDQFGHLQVDLGSLDGVANTVENPTYHTIAGDPSGDFAGVSIFDEVVAGNLGLATFPQSPGQKTAKAADCVVLASDQAQDLLVAGNSGMALNHVLFQIDTVSGYPVSFHSFYCEVDIPLGWTAGAFIFEGSNTGLGGWCPLTVYDDAAVTGTPINAAITPAANTQRFFSGKATYRFIRLRISTVFAGCFLQALCRFSPTDYVPRVTTVGNNTAANLTGTMSIAGAQTLATVTTVGTVSTITAGTITPAPSTNSIGLTNLILNAAGALTAIKGSAGNLYGFSVQNNNAAVAYLEVWNVATGSVTLGTTAPIAVYIIPASGSLTIPPHLSLMYSATALCYAVVTAYNGSSLASVTGTIFYA